MYQLLEDLSKHHVFISYSDAVNKIINGKIDKPYLVFSSDDGLKNNIRAAEILSEFGAKSCFFINPSIIGENDIQKIKSFCDDRLIFPLVEFLTWKDVEYIQSLGHEIGSHTMDHINIAEVNEDIIRQDMEMTYNIIREKCGNSNHFAFPYGRFFHFSEIGRKACFDVGFKSCATAERGCHVNPPRILENGELCLLRDHLVLDWGIDHMMYFILKSAKEASPQTIIFPIKKNNESCNLDQFIEWRGVSSPEGIAQKRQL